MPQALWAEREEIAGDGGRVEAGPQQGDGVTCHIQSNQHAAGDIARGRGDLIDDLKDVLCREVADHIVVMAFAKANGIDTGAAKDEVIAGTAGYGVSTATAADDVVAGTAIGGLVGVSADDQVVAALAVDKGGAVA